MEDKKCVMFVEGKECGLRLIPIDRQAQKVARYDWGIYECSIGHRSYHLLEPSQSKGPTRTE